MDSMDGPDIDDNDNEPLFDKVQYRIRVISPLPNNTLLKTIRAVDHDKVDYHYKDQRSINHCLGQKW